MPKPVPSEPGTTVVQETRTRIEPNAPAKVDRAQRPPMWEYFEMLRAPEDWTKISLWIKRYEGSETVWLDKMDGEQLADLARANKPFSPEYLKSEYGGGKYKFMVKERGELIYSFEDRVSGEPVDPRTPKNQQQQNGGGNDGALAQVLNRLVDLIERRDNPAGGNLVVDAARNGMQIQADGLRAAVTAIASTAPQVSQAPSRAEALMDKLLETMIMKMMNPTDPIETFGKMAAAIKGMPGFGGTGKESTLGTIMSALPGVADKIVDGLRYYAQIQNTQAQMQTVGRPQLPAHQPHIAHQMPASPIPQAAAPTPQPTPQPSAAPVATEAESGRFPWQDVLEMQVMNILTDLEKPLDGCVSEVMICCDNIDGRLAEMLTANGESGMEAIFSQGPFLPKIPKDARLKEFMRLFILDVAAAKSAPKPVAPAAGPVLLQPEPPVPTTT